MLHGDDRSYGRKVGCAPQQQGKRLFLVAVAVAVAAVAVAVAALDAAPFHFSLFLLLLLFFQSWPLAVLLL